MKQVAEETGVTLLDITTPTLDWIEGIGDEASKAYFMISTGKNDNTHTVASGARKVTEIVCDAIRSQLPAVAAHLVRYDIVVSADGHGDYRTVQEAVNAIPDYSHSEITTVYIRSGVYKEQVIIPHSKFRVHFKGEDAAKTIITFDKYAKKNWPGRDFPIGTSGSASIYIHASYLTFEDLSFENSAGEGKDIAQAVAVFTDGDFLFFNRCRFLGNQDTLYTYGRYGKFGGVKRNYFKDCYIEGTTDFIFGPSIAYFEGCTLHSKKNSYVTAASTFQGQKYGYVFRDCTLTAVPGVDKVYLGRPWGAYARTVFLHCHLGAHILPEGWHDWEKPGKPDTRKNSYYGEYQNDGPGARGPRVKWSRQLTARQAAEYSFEKVMYQKEDGILWNPYDNR
jgi:pectinesterase